MQAGFERRGVLRHGDATGRRDLLGVAHAASRRGRFVSIPAAIEVEAVDPRYGKASPRGTGPLLLGSLASPSRRLFGPEIMG